MINFLLLPAASFLRYSVDIGDGVLLTRLFRFSVDIGDGVLLTRLFFASLMFWPFMASCLVFVAQQKRILKPIRYFVSSIAAGYTSVFAIPTLILFGYAFAGRSAEEATLIALFLTPLLLVVPVVVSVLCARTCR